MSAIRTYVLLVTIMHATYGLAADRRIEQPIAPAPVTSAATDGTTLGRLFYTPAQRAALDELRQRPLRVVHDEKRTTLPTAPEYVTLNGIVRRSDGATTVWLNDKQVRGRESEEGLQITPSRRGGTAAGVTVRVPQTGQVVDLKVGQQVDLNSGQVKEGFRAPQGPSGDKLAESTSKPDNATRDAPAASSPARRPDRQREMLRDLLDEIGKPSAGGAAPNAAESKGERSP